MGRYNREERSHDRDEPPASSPPGQFPWQESARADQPEEVWEGPPDGQVGDAAPARPQDGGPNRMAIAGFVLSLLMWIPFPEPAGFINFLFWVMALTFSSIGLRRSRKRGLPQKGLAIAGLCICLVSVVLLIILAALFAAGMFLFN